MAKLFIVGFPKDMEEIELVEIFSSYGTVNTVTIVTDKDTGASRCFGFVTMLDDAGAERAIAAMDGAEIDDRKISVRIAEDKCQPRQESVRTEFQKPYTAKSVFIPKIQEPETVKKKRPRRPI